MHDNSDNSGLPYLGGIAKNQAVEVSFCYPVQNQQKKSHASDSLENKKANDFQQAFHTRANPIRATPSVKGL